MKQLLTELRNNFRLRIGIWLILAILGSYIVILTYDYQEKITSDYNEATKRLTQLKTIVGQPEWIERARQIDDLQLQLEKRLWIANSKGLARADLQAWLDSQATVAKVVHPRSKVETVLEIKKAKLWKVTAQLDGKFSSKSVDRLLFAIAEHTRWIVIERLEIRPSTFTLVVTVYFQAPI